MANTTWNPSDKNASITLSGGNLIATDSAAALAAVRSIHKLASGKYYWEITYNVADGASGGTGISLGYIPLNQSFSSVAQFGYAGLNTGGTLYVNGVSQVTGFGTLTVGVVICLALDLNNKL